MKMGARRVFIASAGTFLEWAEFTYYAYIASDIAKLFFPSFTAQTGLFATFSVFALSYLFRPLGALFFGYMGDKYGRRIALQISIIFMGITSILIGLLPTYSTIGVFAPICLLILRCCQGFAVAGEFNGSAIYLIEHSPNNPCRAGSWTGFASALGMMCGSLMSTLVVLPGAPVWMWRLPFFLGAASCFCAMYLRKFLSESPEYDGCKNVHANPLQLLLTNYKKPLLQAILIIAAIGVYLYIMSVYYGVYLTENTTLSPTEIKLIVTVGQAFLVAFIWVIGKFADRFAAEFIMRLGFMGFFVAAPLVYILPFSNIFIYILLGQIIYAFCNALVGVPVFKILNSYFPANVRYSGVSLAWTCSMAIFGGTAPLVASCLQVPVIYILIMASIALWVSREEQVYFREVA